MKLINPFKVKLNRAIAWFDQRPLRERALLVAAVVAMMYFFVDLVIIGASEARAKVLKRRLDLQVAEVATVRKQVAELSSLAAQSPVKQELSQFEKMKRTIAEADELMTQLDSAPRVGDVVKTLLRASPGLELVSLKTLPVTLALDGNLAKPPAAATAKPPATVAIAKPEVPVRPLRSIYRHGIEISVKGSYLALLPWLERLQNHPGRLQWGDMSVDVQSHPGAVLKVTIYTMSGSANPSLG